MRIGRMINIATDRPISRQEKNTLFIPTSFWWFSDGFYRTGALNHEKRGEMKIITMMASFTNALHGHWTRTRTQDQISVIIGELLKQLKLQNKLQNWLYMKIGKTCYAYINTTLINSVFSVSLYIIRTAGYQYIKSTGCDISMVQCDMIW